MKITKDTITEKIQNRERSNLKKFTFTMEDINDNPESTINTIKEYLDSYKDQIRDFKIITSINENNFAPEIYVQVFYTEEVEKHFIDSYKKLYDN